jgi:ATP-dependent RNA helicase DDX55/SPB4
MCYMIGGNKIEYDLQRINERGCNILVGTVGRIFDLFKRETISFKKIEILVMDEADKILEDGHESQISHIMSVLPRQRRTGLFSATMTSQLKNLIKLGMRNPFFIEVRLENEGIFATIKEDHSSVTVKEFDLAGDKEELKSQIKEISEVPSNLLNFY